MLPFVCTAITEMAVTVAVITSRHGLPIGRRKDGSPPWTFPGGKIELGCPPVALMVPHRPGR